jgi:hypothetical protein
MLGRVALVRTDVSEERMGSIIRVTRIDDLRTTLATAVPSSPILVILMMEAIISSEMSVLTTTPQRNLPEDGIVHSHRREDIKVYRTVFLLTCCKLNKDYLRV